MGKKVLCFALTVALCLSFAACSTTSQPEEQAKSTTEPATEATEAPAEDKVFKTSDGMFQLTADENWTSAEETLGIADASLAIAKGVKASKPAEASDENDGNGTEDAEGYIALISEYKYNFSDGLSGYDRMVVKHMEKNVDEEKTGETEELKLGDYSAYKTVMSGKVDGLQVVYVIYCAEVSDYYIQMICWSPDTGQEKLAAEFDRIARSLQPAQETE